MQDFLHITLGNVITWSIMLIGFVVAVVSFVNRVHKIDEKSNERFEQNAKAILSFENKIIAVNENLIRIESEGSHGALRAVQSVQETVKAHEIRLTNHDMQLRQLDVAVNDIQWIRHAIQWRWQVPAEMDPKSAHGPVGQTPTRRG